MSARELRFWLFVWAALCLAVSGLGAALCASLAYQARDLAVEAEGRAETAGAALVSARRELGAQTALVQVLREDVEVAHARIDVLIWQLGVVIDTCPGRARPPRPPKPIPARPTYPAEEEP